MSEGTAAKSLSLLVSMRDLLKIHGWATSLFEASSLSFDVFRMRIINNRQQVPHTKIHDFKLKLLKNESYGESKKLYRSFNSM
jgi:hypothetical protein